jgi:hypothetical protein
MSHVRRTTAPGQSFITSTNPRFGVSPRLGAELHHEHRGHGQARVVEPRLRVRASSRTTNPRFGVSPRLGAELHHEHQDHGEAGVVHGLGARRVGSHAGSELQYYVGGRATEFASDRLGSALHPDTRVDLATAQGQSFSTFARWTTFARVGVRASVLHRKPCSRVRERSARLFRASDARSS